MQNRHCAVRMVEVQLATCLAFSVFHLFPGVQACEQVQSITTLEFVVHLSFGEEHKVRHWKTDAGKNPTTPLFGYIERLISETIDAQSDGNLYARITQYGEKRGRQRARESGTSEGKDKELGSRHKLPCTNNRKNKSKAHKPPKSSCPQRNRGTKSK